MSRRTVLTWMGMMAVVVLMLATPLAAQNEPAKEAAGGGGLTVPIASILTAGFALGIAAGLGAIGQGRAIGSAAEAIARNPSASGDIRGALILGLVLIESLVIYVLFISIMLFFRNPFIAKPGA